MKQTIRRQQVPLVGPEDVACLIDAELNEMPGMRLTFAQVKRLWSLSDDDCRTALDYLVSSGRLSQDDDGRFSRSPGAY